MRSCHDGQPAYRSGPVVDLGGPDLTSRLARWVAESSVAEAAKARSRERWLRAAAAGEASFAGVLVDLAERGSPVVVAGASGRRHRGIVAAVGDGFVVLRVADGSHVLLVTTAVASVRAEPRAEPTTGDRPVDLPMDLADALAALAEDRPRLLVVTNVDGDGLAGDLCGAGLDVLTLRLDGPDRSYAYVPLATVAEVRLG